MIKSFFGQVVFCFVIPEPYLLTLAKTDYPSILSILRTNDFPCVFRYYYGVNMNTGSGVFKD